MIVIADSSPIIALVNIQFVDERAAYKAAVARSIPAIGTVRVLERAAEASLLDLADAFCRLKEQTDFWVKPELLDQRLDLFLKQQKRSKRPST